MFRIMIIVENGNIQLLVSVYNKPFILNRFCGRKCFVKMMQKFQIEKSKTTSK